MFRGRSFLTRANIILYILLEEDFLGECIEKRFLFFEHKGTRIFQTCKPPFEKKHHTRCFLNYQPIFDEQNRRFPTQVHFERCM